MFEIKAKSANHALAEGIGLVLRSGERSTSRNGDVLVVPEPVMVTYMDPTKRVLMSPTRDANPFFHLMESLWMLGGRNDLAFLQKFVSTFDRYSDDGVTLHGAYGHRWRRHFGRDQLDAIADELLRSPDSRRCVLGMWDPSVDLQKLESGGKDVPCNTQAYFDIRDGRLNMTVCNRSNDAVFGCFGANLVHFSILLEFMAAKVDADVGVYHQFTNNLHIYTNVFDVPKLEKIASESEISNTRSPWPLVSTVADIWMAENEAFLKGSRDGFVEDFFPLIAVPMIRAWEVRKEGAPTDEILDILMDIAADDWRDACVQWVMRRAK